MIENQQLGLYDPAYEHDACGIGFVAHIKGTKSHQNVGDALTILENMAVSYTHLRAHETTLHLVCRLLLEKRGK